MKLSQLLGVIMVMLVGFTVLLLAGGAAARLIAEQTGVSYESLRGAMFGVVGLVGMFVAWLALRRIEGQTEQEKAKRDQHADAEARLAYTVGDDGELVPLEEKTKRRDA